MYTIVLSRRNLKVLLSKLDRVVRGEESTLSIIKYPEDGNIILVSAAEDEEVYGNREPGTMLPIDVLDES